MFNSVIGHEVMILGDLHFSDVFTGKHINYLDDCFWCLRQISDKIEAERPSAVVLGGDIVGWVETNVKDRQVFSMLCKVLRSWNEICPVYAVRGNHDLKGYPDFQFLAEFNLIITSSMCDGYFDYFAYEGQEKPEVRFHIVDYNSEDRALNVLEGTSNIVLGHNNFTINGLTTWYNEHDGIELGMLQNFADVDMVISGHIHNPSPEIIATRMVNGKSCMLFYPGCPTRPVRDSNMYESCWYLFVRYNETTGESDVAPEEFQLKPSSEVFYAEETFVDEKTEDEVQEELRKGALKDVLSDLLVYRMNTGNPIDQVDRIPNASPEAKEVAKSYLQLAFNNN